MRALTFIRRGQPVVLANVPPDRTLLELLREDLGATGTKEGCGEGDCGACTVVLGDMHGGRIRYRAINACIRMAHSIDGMALWTVEDLAQDPLIEAAPGGHAASTALHPAQEALVQAHGSQCGFCTPGFVMSLFAMYQNRCCQGQAVTRDDAVHDLSGNLCRCTGYRPILDAAQAMGDLPVRAVNEARLLQQLEQIKSTPSAVGPDFSYISPPTEAALLAARAAHPQAQLVAGCTDVGLWVTKQHRQFGQVLDVTRAAELLRIEAHGGHLVIGAAATLTDAFAALQQHWPGLARFAARFAGLPVRNSGTLGGNVANGSPIGDSMPLLIALRAEVELGSVRGTRRLALEDLYTGYRKTAMAADELLLRIHVPLPQPHERLEAYKVSKRFDDDISAVCLVINLAVADGMVQSASIGAGGVAATPARARAAEAALQGQPWSEATLARAGAALQAEFTPLSDMRASAEYRRAVLAALPQRYWLQTQGTGPASVDALALEDLQ